jgi:hypothetical protein
MLFYILLLITVLPNFIFGINVGALNNLIVFTIFSGVIFIKCKDVELDNVIKYSLFFYFTLEFLVLITAFTDVGYSTIGLSLFRPVMLLITFLGLYILIINDIDKSITDVFNYSRIVVILSFLFYAFYSMTSIGSFIHLNFYTTKTVLSTSSISFFATSYFAAFTYTFCFIFNLISLTKKMSMFSFLILILNTILVFFSHSKTAFVCIIIIIIITVYMHPWKFKYKLLSNLLFIIIGVFVYDNYTQNIIDSRGIVSFSQMLRGDGGGYNSLNERAEQIYFAIHYSMNNMGLGVGTDSSILNESFVSDFVYRYGILGLSLYAVFWGVLTFMAVKLYMTCQENKHLFFSFLCWFISLPILGMSNSVLEMGKGAVINAFIIALFLSVIKFKYQNSFNRQE